MIYLQIYLGIARTMVRFFFLTLTFATLLCVNVMYVKCLSTSPKFYNTAKREEKPGVLNVHIVCHTHDDVGWLKTVDQYYQGSNNTIQQANIAMILDTVTQQLERDPNRKFTYVEQAYFKSILRNAPESLTTRQISSGTSFLK